MAQIAQKNSSEKGNSNRSIVEALYRALSDDDPETVVGFVAPDLEWWFHGPPHRHHMMRLLTGEASHGEEFSFTPRSVTAIKGGDMVVAEGWEYCEKDNKNIYWVHVWNVKGGVITHLREYFNTSLTVRDLTRPVISEITRRLTGPTIWKSAAIDVFSQSLPGLVLAL